MRVIGLFSDAPLILLSSAVLADEQEPLVRKDIIDLVRGKTVECIKEKDLALCSNYFTRRASSRG